MNTDQVNAQGVQKAADDAVVSRVPTWLVNYLTNPVPVTISLFIAAFAFAGWYLPNHVTGPIAALHEDMAANTKGLTEQIDDTFEKLHASLETKVDSVEEELRAEIDTTQADISKDIGELQVTANSAAERLDQTILEIPAASKVSEELKQTRSEVELLSQDVDSAERKVDRIEMLIKLGIRHPAVQETVVKLIDANPDLFSTPEAIAAFWESKKDQSASEFEQFILSNYKEINAKEAMLMAYDSLSEERSVAFFIDLEELKANTEPKVGAAIEAIEDNLIEGELPGRRSASDLSKFDSLTVIGVCDALTDVADTDCFKYFLDGSREASNDSLFSDIDANKAVVRAIANKYEELIPES